MTTISAHQEKKYKRLIIVLSVVVPVAVAVLLGIRVKVDLGLWTKFLPHINALLNTGTAFLLLVGLYFISKKDITNHKRMMLSALVLGGLFLVGYVIYHLSNASVIYGDANHDGVLQAAELAKISSWRSLYLFFLISHIGLSIGVLPFVLFAFYFALTGKITNHKKIVKFTFPIWLYVTVTGVIVYFMINPYYVP